MVTKQELRAKLKSELKNLEHDTYETWSSKIAMTVFESEEWKNARVIGLTLSMNREVDTVRLIERAWLEGKAVCVPKCEPATKLMDFYKITSFDQLEVVYFSLKEPIVERTQKVSKQEIDLLFVPGLAFTKSGYRLGQGGGYYDRYLIDFQGKTVSLAFSISIVEELPIESFDIPVQQIITNSNILNCHG
ncbi:5-formyltetrahydrofolate cyclo-ligase [Litchfieldia alkalitelluris]|uniref:5-formyltetrahydrofolate cyclo-ligase n=1 Tax=Litchfieldia alkalitelluris TaxID=304268 RepID=UPI0009987472|nr:5-formyltetrahydrofolate cyclo-ligase [Litchfieldia alkalitelluris]